MTPIQRQWNGYIIKLSRTGEWTWLIITLPGQKVTHLGWRESVILEHCTRPHPYLLSVTVLPPMPDHFPISCLLLSGLAWVPSWWNGRRIPDCDTQSHKFCGNRKITDRMDKYCLTLNVNNKNTVVFHAFTSFSDVEMCWLKSYQIGRHFHKQMTFRQLVANSRGLYFNYKLTMGF